MKFKPAKCTALLCINSRPLKFVESFSPSFKGEPIRALKWGERYRYLGVPLGHTRISSLNDLKSSIISKAKAICSSLLTESLYHQHFCCCRLLIPSKSCTTIEAAGKTLTVLFAKLESTSPTDVQVLYFTPVVSKVALGCSQCVINKLSVNNLNFSSQLSQFFRVFVSPDRFVRLVALKTNWNKRFHADAWKTPPRPDVLYELTRLSR